MLPLEKFVNRAIKKDFVACLPETGRDEWTRKHRKIKQLINFHHSLSSFTSLPRSSNDVLCTHTRFQPSNHSSLLFPENPLTIKNRSLIPFLSSGGRKQTLFVALIDALRPYFIIFNCSLFFSFPTRCANKGDSGSVETIVSVQLGPKATVAHLHVRAECPNLDEARERAPEEIWVVGTFVGGCCAVKLCEIKLITVFITHSSIFRACRIQT